MVIVSRLTTNAVLQVTFIVALQLLITIGSVVCFRIAPPIKVSCDTGNPDDVAYLHTSVVRRHATWYLPVGIAVLWADWCLVCTEGLFAEGPCNQHHLLGLHKAEAVWRADMVAVVAAARCF